MDHLFLTLFCVCFLTSLTGACLSRDTSLCPSKNPLVFGGRIQPQDPDNPLWENGRKVFVFQPPPQTSQGHMGSRRGFGVRGPRGVIRIGRKSCTGSSEESTFCPATFNSNLPCRLQGKGPCTSDPLYFENITSSSVHVDWTHFDPLVRAKAAISGYIVQIRPLGGEFQEITTAEEVTFYDFYLLTPDTTYELRLVPITDSTSGENGRIQTIKTLCGVPSSPEISVGETTSRAAVINVQIPSTQDWQCSNIIVHFQKEVGEEWVDVQELDPLETEIEIDNLTPCFNYKYRVQLSNYHETVFSDVLTVHTKAEGLTAVGNATAISDASQLGQLNVSWSPPESPDTACTVSYYNIQYSLIKYKTCPDDEQSAPKYVDAIDIEVTLDYLEDYADYNVSVTPMMSTVDNSGFIPGEKITFTGSTAANNPTEAPSGILLTGVSQTSLKFSWKPPQNCRMENGIIISYSYILRNDGVEVAAGSTEKTDVALEGLEPNTKYNFMVSAVNSAGSGPFSERVWEETRYRTPSCPGKRPLQFGGLLRRGEGAVGNPPWGTGQPIFILPHHVKNPFKRGGGVAKVWFVQTRDCGGSPGLGPCPGRRDDNPTKEPITCPREEEPVESSQCDAVCPRFSESTEVFSTESRDVSSVFLNWRDWDVTVDRGIGPVTGYLLRHGKVGETQTEIQKGLSLHHLFTNLAINTDYSFEVVGLKGTSATRGSLCEGSTSSRIIYTPGCGKLAPVQDLTVTNNGELGTLHVSWTAPDGLCPVSFYKVSYPLRSLKACGFDELSSFIEPPMNVNETDITLTVYDDFAEYNISVTAITESLDGTGFMDGETTLVIGTTEENVPLMSPRVKSITESQNSVDIDWGKIGCGVIRGNFTMFSYSLLQEDVFYNGTTQKDNVHIDNLIAYGNYTFSVRAHTTAGPGPLSDQYTGTTPESTPLSYNSNMTVMTLTGITATSITLSWPKWDKSVGEGNGTADSYMFLYGEQGMEPLFTVVQNVEHRFENLTVDTEYHFQIAIIGRGLGNGVRGSLSERQTFRTPCGVPATPVLSVDLNKVTSSAAVFHYEFPGEDDPWKCGNISIFFQMENEHGDWKTIKDIMPNAEFQYVDKSGLLHCTDYRFRMKLENRHEVAFSNIVDVGTNIEKLGDVRDLNVATQDEDGQVLVTWNPPENEDNCTILHYGVWIDLVNDEHCDYNNNIKINKGSYIVNTTELLIRNLEPYSTFRVGVKPLLNYGEDPTVGSYKRGTTKSVSPKGVVFPELIENVTSARSLTFSWEGSGLPCENQLGPNFGYECVLYELNTGSPVLVKSKRLSNEWCIFSDLKPCGEYSCRVRPVNEDNEGEFSSPVNGSISSAALGSIRNISAIPLYNGDVVIRWLPPDNSSNLCPPAGFKLNYILQRHQACSKCIDRAQPSMTTNETSYLMQNLSPFTTYKINIVVDIDDDDSYLVPKEKVFTTRFASPSERPSVYHDDTQATNTSLVFNWTSPNCNTLNGIFKQYTIGGNSTKGETGVAGKSTHSFTLDHLAPCTVYSFTLRFVNIVGRGPMNVAFGKTALGKPGGEFNLLLQPQSNGDLLATWQESEENPCPVDSYKINIATVGLGVHKCGEKDGFDTSDKVVDKNDRNFTFKLSEDSLIGDTEYRVTIRGVNSLGESRREVATAFTDVLAPSGSPRRVFSGRANSTHVKVSWKMVTCLQSNGDITEYQYQLTLDGVLVEESTTLSRIAQFSDLTPSTSYTFKVRAKTSAGFGPFTDDFIVTTTA